MKRTLLHCSFLMVMLCAVSAAQQVADPDFAPKVEHPAFTSSHPLVLIDEAHNNFHTSTGRYKPFADLIVRDGYQVAPNKNKFNKESLKGVSILVISNALGASMMGSPEASNPAFSDEECDVIRDWVNSGGRLLLIADHAPMGAAAERLSLRFGVDMSKGYTGDPNNYDVASDNEGFIKYNRENKLLVDCAITRGRNPGEQVSRVIAFTGQSLKGPAGSEAFLKLSDSAVDVTPGPSSERKQNSAAGRAQGIALKVGQGRVIVLGEAAMLSAQIVGPDKVKFGMNRSDTDNVQLALNIMHWLSGLIG